ncbi:hypothetical protein EML15_09175 [Corynebacterium sp. sy017]|nr:hypothetical protein [Corynebacterium sp. sy017]
MSKSVEKGNERTMGDIRARSSMVVTLYLFLFKHQVRQLLSVGVLKEKWARVMLLVALVVIVFSSSIISFLFYQKIGINESSIRLVLGLSNLVIPLWATIGFLVAKLLLMRTGSLMKLTTSMPITDFQRRMALFLMELTIATLCATFFLLPSLISLTLACGFSSLSESLTSIVYPFILLLLALIIAYNLLEKGARVLRLQAISSHVALILTVGVALVISADITYGLSTLTTAFSKGENYWRWSNVLTRILVHNGMVVSTLVFFVAFAVCITFAVVTHSPLGISTRMYLKAHYPGVSFAGLVAQQTSVARSVEIAIMMSIIRSKETWIAVLFSVLGYVAILKSRMLPPECSLELIACMGIYSYSTVRPLRKMYSRVISPAREYCYLVKALVWLCIPIALLFILGSFLSGNFGLHTVVICLGCVSSIPLTTTAGILVPAAHDNPISALVGLGILMSVVLMTSLVTSLFSLNTWGYGVVFGVVVVVVAAWGITLLRDHSRLH